MKHATYLLWWAITLEAPTETQKPQDIWRCAVVIGTKTLAANPFIPTNCEDGPPWIPLDQNEICFRHTHRVIQMLWKKTWFEQEFKRLVSPDIDPRGSTRRYEPDRRNAWWKKKEANSRSDFQNMAMKCLFCLLFTKKKKLYKVTVKHQTQTVLNLPLIKYCRSRTMELTLSNKVQWCLRGGTVLHASEPVRGKVAERKELSMCRVGATLTCSQGWLSVELPDLIVTTHRSNKEKILDPHHAGMETHGLSAAGHLNTLNRSVSFRHRLQTSNTASCSVTVGWMDRKKGMKQLICFKTFKHWGFNIDQVHNTKAGGNVLGL